MTKHRKPKKRKSGGGPGPSPEQQTAEAFEALRETIMHLEADPSAGRLWGDAQHALLKTRADRRDVMRIVASRDLDDLRKMLDALESGQTHLQPAATDADAGEGSGDQYDHETLKRAMRAFRKRLKLARLDDESRLSVSPMSSGKRSQIDAILAPREFPDGVWRQLARDGQLIDLGQGFYELASEHSR